MSKRKSTADARLRKLKIRHQREVMRLKQGYERQLATLEKLLQPVLKGQCYHHDALMNLLTSPDESNSDTLIGAMLFQRWLWQSGRDLQKALTTYRHSLET